MYTLSSGRIRFGAFELDLSTGELRSTDTPDLNKVLLREQVFQVLRMLLARERKIVTREEIKAKLWANDTVVDFGHSINVTIKTLRRALGDSADNPQYIETLARRGYRFLPDVHEHLDRPGPLELSSKLIGRSGERHQVITGQHTNTLCPRRRKWSARRLHLAGISEF
jgi:DNA-binding winged helix-turn-helix (wHTH) protein